jgi:hypothetical protein
MALEAHPLLLLLLLGRPPLRCLLLRMWVQVGPELPLV